MLKDNIKVFIITAIIWEVVVAILYGVFFRYSVSTTFNRMNLQGFYYKWSIDPHNQVLVRADTTQIPYPYVVVSIALILLIVGLALMAGYIQKSSVMGITLTLLIFALTIQNFFIYRIFWQNASVNDPNQSTSTWSKRYYDLINPINAGNDLSTTYAFGSAGFIDAIGASLAMFAAYTAVIGRIGLAQVFFLTWLGPFFYELNSQLLWRFTWSDTGYPLRAFAFGGTLGLVSSLILGKRQLTQNNKNYFSTYKTMGMALIGMVIVWCTFPIVLLSSTYTTATGTIVANAGQVNMWQALGSSALGVFATCAIYYRKFSVHDLVFSALSGGIAYSAVSDINYNTGAATGIGFLVGFICSLLQIIFKRRLNSNGVIDSNGTLFQFIIPSFFAAIAVAIGQGVGNSSASFATLNSTGGSPGTVTYNGVIQNGRSYASQGGYQIVAWLLSIGFGAVAGLIIGIFYKMVNQYDHKTQCFNDKLLYLDESERPSSQGKYIQKKQKQPSDEVVSPQPDMTPNDSNVKPKLVFDYYA